MHSSLQQWLSARAQGHQVVRQGLVLPFDDQADFLLETDLDTERSPEDLRKLGKRWDHLNQGRSAVLMALSRHAHQAGGTTTLRLDGRLDVETRSVSLSIEVSRDLTDLIESGSREQALMTLTEHWWGLKIKTTKKAQALLADARPSSDATKGKPAASLADVLPSVITALDCADLEKGPETKQSATDFLTRFGVNMQSKATAVVNELRQRLPPDSVSVDLLRPYATQLEYADGEDSLLLITRGKRLERLAQSLGVEGAADQILAGYRDMDAKRSNFLRALDHLMARAGCRRSAIELGESRIYGRTHREIAMKTGRPLTLALRKGDAETVLEKLWAKDASLLPPLNPGEVEAALESGDQKPLTINLLEQPPASAIELPELSATNIALADAETTSLIETFKSLVSAGDYRLACWWHEPEWYHRGHDTWVNEDWWLAQARHPESTVRCPGLHLAIRLLNGDEDIRAGILEDLRSMEYYDAECLENCLFWLCHDQLPWLLKDGDWPLYPILLGPAPVRAAWRAAMKVKGELQDPPEDCYGVPVASLKHLHREDANDWLAPDEIEQIHAGSLAIASSSDPKRMLNEDMLHTAQNMGWTDVAEALSMNPLTLPSLEEWEDSFPAFGPWAARISAVQPTEFSARLALHCLLSPADERERAILQRCDEMVKACSDSMSGMMTMSPEQSEQMKSSARETMDKDYLHGRIQAAIAWHRRRVSEH